MQSKSFHLNTIDKSQERSTWFKESKNQIEKDVFDQDRNIIIV